MSNFKDSTEEYAKTTAMDILMEKLAEGEKSANDNGWLSADDVKSIIEE